MKDLKSILCFWLMMWMFSCTGDPFESTPVVKLGDNENKQFTFTNKVSGYYLGNSHLENKSVNHGWTVNNIRYLKGYRIYANNKLIQRDSLHQFNYYPFTIVREYGIPVKERFTLLDSVDAIVWEFDLSSELKDFSFEPIVNREENETEKNILSSSSSQLIFSPQELVQWRFGSRYKMDGFSYLTTGKNTVIILCVLEASQYRLKYALEKLSINFDSRIDQRINRILSIVKTNNTITNIPEITEALAWAQLSLDALITQQERRGIWAGLPLFNHYRGRETFISFAGALLVNGKFGEAREILNSFSRIQLRDENDSWDGRIPHRVTDEEIVYNSADVTWWFIREVYEYYLYSADSAFVQEIFPVIKRCYSGRN